MTRRMHQEPDPVNAKEAGGWTGSAKPTLVPEPVRLTDHWAPLQEEMARLPRFVDALPESRIFQLVFFSSFLFTGCLYLLGQSFQIATILAAQILLAILLQAKRYWRHDEEIAVANEMSRPFPPERSFITDTQPQSPELRRGLLLLHRAVEAHNREGKMLAARMNLAGGSDACRRINLELYLRERQRLEEAMEFWMQVALAERQGLYLLTTAWYDSWSSDRLSLDSLWRMTDEACRQVSARQRSENELNLLTE